MRIREAHALGRERIDFWRFDFPGWVVAANVPVAEVIAKDDDDVWALGSVGAGEEENEGEE